MELILGNKKWRLKDNSTVEIGRKGFGSQIEIDDPHVSRKHAQVTIFKGQVFVKDLESTAGTTLEGQKLVPGKNTRVATGSSFHIGSHHFELKMESFDSSGTQNSGNQGNLKQRLEAKGLIKIGRRLDNDVVINDPTVGREHALIHHQNNQYWLEDLDSLNGTYLNGRKIPTRKKIRIELDDEIIISLTALNLSEGVSNHGNSEVAISARNISKIFKNKDPKKPGKGLQPLSVEINSGDFVALMGPSGCGKSTLLRCLNNDNPANTGEVLIKGITISKEGDRTRSFNSIKKKIGYVPQDDIIHRDLTVEQTLKFASKLRLPDDTKNDAIEHRINQVLSDVNLDQSFKDKLISKLSGGQRKRVCIAVEMLTEPTILFLDEPTSPLDPESIDSFLKSLQKLAKKGTTIVMVTHKPDDLDYADKAIFLMSSGNLCFYGNPEELKGRFKADTYAEVYSEVSLEDPDAQPVHLRPEIEAANRKKVDDYYIAPQISPKKKRKPVKKGTENNEHGAARQLYWLLSRYAKIKVTDKSNLLLLLAQPVLIASLISVIFQELQMGVLFLTGISGIWFGVSNSAKEIVGELPIYRRERMFNVRLHTYILSKWIVLSGTALIQSLIFIAILYARFNLSTSEEFPDIVLKSFSGSVLFMFYIATSASLIGLLLSARFQTTEQVMTVVPIALMPQIMLAGVITKIDNWYIELLSFFTLGRWGTEILGRVQDAAYESENVLTESLVPPVPLPPIINEAGEQISPGTNAAESLNFYAEGVDLIGGAFDSLLANSLWVIGLNTLMYILIYVSLKKK